MWKLKFIVALFSFVKIKIYCGLLKFAVVLTPWELRHSEYWARGKYDQE